MQLEVLLTSFILLIIGCIGLVESNTLIKNVISIETITLSSILNVICHENIINSVLLILVIIIVSEIYVAILFMINNIRSNKN